MGQNDSPVLRSVEVRPGAQPEGAKSDGATKPAPAATRKNSLRFISSWTSDLKFIPNHFAEPTGKKRKEKTHSESDRDHLGAQKRNFPHYNPLQTKARPRRQVSNQRPDPHAHLINKRDHREVAHRATGRKATHRHTDESAPAPPTV